MPVVSGAGSVSRGVQREDPVFKLSIAMSAFTRSIPDRCFAAFLSILLMIPAGWGLYTYFTIDHSDDDPDWIVRLFVHVGMDVVGVAFLLSVLGLIWAVFAPAWLSRLAQRTREHFVLGLAAFLGVILLMLAILFLI